MAPTTNPAGGPSLAGRPSLVVLTSRQGPNTTVRLSGELDIATAAVARATLQDLVATDSPSHVVVDMSALAFVDVAGLGVLLFARKALGGRLALLHPSAMVRRVIDLLDLADALPVLPDETVAHEPRLLSPTR